MTCTIPKNKFSSSACEVFQDTVIFGLTSNTGTSSSPCQIDDIDSQCDGTLNADGCGCVENAGADYVIAYNLTADRSLHDGARWKCQPKCYRSSGDFMLNAPNRSTCFSTSFSGNIFFWLDNTTVLFFVCVDLCV